MCVLLLCPRINNLFLISVERQFFSLDSNCDTPWLIFRREGNAPMLKCLPLRTCSSSSSTDGFFQFYLKPSTTTLKLYPLDKSSVAPDLLAYFGFFTFHYPIHYFNCGGLVQKLVVVTTPIGIGATRTASFAHAGAFR